MQKGFTLIELLVVVLIIGILAAVAVPQYQKTVAKARAAEAVSVLNSIVLAEQAYYLASGQYALDLEDLDIGIPHNPNISYSATNSGATEGSVSSYYRGTAWVDKVAVAFEFPFEASSSARWCFAAQGNVLANQVCASYGALSHEGFGQNYYKMR